MVRDRSLADSVGVRMYWGACQVCGRGSVAGPQEAAGLLELPSNSIVVALLLTGMGAALAGVSLWWMPNVEFNTVHSAKGREAGYVVVLDM